jgi:hypothetical protein
MDGSVSFDAEGQQLSAGADAEGKKPGCCSAFLKMPITQVQLILRIINMLNCVVIVVVYPLRFTPFSFVTQDPFEDFPIYFLMVYTVLFSCVFCCFEADLPFVRDRQARYFRFMYNYLSRFLFMLFIASLCLVSNYWMGYVAGALTVMNAIFNAIVLCIHPGWKIKHLMRDPTKQYSSSLQAAKGAALDSARFVHTRNPDLAARVADSTKNTATNIGSAAMQYARDNPDQVRGATDAVGSAALNYARENPDAALRFASAASQALPSSGESNEINPFG